MNILIAVDNSVASRQAAEVAFSMFGSEPHYSVISVAELQPMMVGRWGAGAFSDAAMFLPVVEEAAKQSAERAALLAAEQQSADSSSPHDVEVLTVAGSAGRGICKAAEEQGSDLIVIGSHDRSFWDRLFDPSVGRYLVEHAPCPVLVVR